jgi:hypothetical protein
MEKIVFVMSLLYATISCSTPEYQKSASQGKKIWGECQVSESGKNMKRSFHLYKLNRSKSSWIEGHSYAKKGEYSLSLKSERIHDKGVFYCVLSLSLLSQDGKNTSQTTETFDCTNGIDVSRKMKLAFKRDSEVWQSIEVMCASRISLKN